MADQALRLLACAIKTDLGGDLGSFDGSDAHPAHKLLAHPSKYAEIESDMVFVGLAGLQDPPRPEVRQAWVCWGVGWGYEELEPWCGRLHSGSH